MSLRITPVVLSGGSGTRLWPLSRSQHPKQFLNLVGRESLFVQTLKRLPSIPNIESPTIICNNDHRFLVAEQLRLSNISPKVIILEPNGRNTAPAAAIACLKSLEMSPSAIIALLPSDHHLPEKEIFQKALMAAAELAEDGYIVTLGVKPDRPETGYGYIEKGDAIGYTKTAFRVNKFIEKPSEQTAKRLLDSENYLWNSGIFVFKAEIFLHELNVFRPDIIKHCASALKNAENDLDFFRLESTSFSEIEGESIDYAIMEKTKLAAVVPLSGNWSDLGTWSSLWNISDTDHNNNAVFGDVFIRDTHGCYLRSEESRILATIGLNDTVVVSTRDAVLVAPKSRANEVKTLIEHMISNQRPEVVWHSEVYRPWGKYIDIDTGNRFRVKRITVNPGGRLSLQRHKKRAEHWVIVAGMAEVTCGKEIITLKPDQSIYIPMGEIHRLANNSDEPLHLIEVQTGSYFGEDDIDRLDDLYGR